MVFGKPNQNHVHSVHASAFFALAEIAGGQFLKQNFPTVVPRSLPIHRAAKVKYQAFVKCDIYSSAKIIDYSHDDLLAELEKNKRVLFKIDVKLFTPEVGRAFHGAFEWFVTLF
jgi:hypothetical protein